jgi:hypothetical protein
MMLQQLSGNLHLCMRAVYVGVDCVCFCARVVLAGVLALQVGCSVSRYQYYHLDSMCSVTASLCSSSSCSWYFVAGPSTVVCSTPSQ